MPMEYHRNKHNMNETPSLDLMTRTALKVISKNENGFFLMVGIAQKNGFDIGVGPKYLTYLPNKRDPVWVRIADNLPTF